ncbi:MULTISPECIES: 1,4-dihydroxy-2-naphthoate polyprenyltransferase [Thermomonospora]|uniref:1,4-dihydroxy-2-naphthoate octaprenyltransferase n=1 Tax=Thermomonospora curvata (strain ATCC 19995 / DSM 43183 / JCM 3096 / KCTC 9072 / NBRC 15933 / NCIMB 10081 / Henssen B9) TaxID=471852 RepID=D1AAE2_THECD|nr:MULTISPECIES: 1,4-dihydroxy-2-naphthoate polyprenyltransferase [Thermomonospora]ACY98855.1 1,4-dihydroxy-2-naphthoateoctaprenyltransferase [Thermomonospora curvata DSM 43183]PKK13060.1 MAG: 1,4-dihydroxy-2-naphthoate polyprenyltransferase [Thermomonospora sp. CIF 1]
MATLAQWIAGSRPRTLPASLVPVAVGTGIAAGEGRVIWWRAALAAIVALALQIGVNYSNDYSDGVRGTDDERVGPLRLVGSGAAGPRQVLAAALGCFLVAAVAGLVLAAVTTWWLLLVGLAAIVAAWFYTGGKNPYGYRALGEVSVFVFFGLVAVVGTVYVQAERLPWEAWAAAVPVGLLACALLVANNLRDIPSDTRAGKRTLAVVLGGPRTRILYAACVSLPYPIALAMSAPHPWVLLAMLSTPLSLPPLQKVMQGAKGAELIPVLGETGRLQVAYGTLLAIGLAL